MFWGILTFHHFTVIDISPAERDAAFNLVQMATQRLFLLQARQQALFLKNVLKAREKISIEYDKVTQPTQLVEKYGQEWMALFSCSGMALIYRDQLQRVGQTLKQSELNKMANWLTEHASHQSCWVSKNLTATALAGIVNLRNHAGLLAIPLPVEQHQTGWLLMFRQAEKQQYRWVGQKSLIKAQTSHPLHAVKERGYEIWVETIADEARSWSNEEQKAAHDFAEDLAVAITLHQINRLNSELQRANQQLKEIAHTDSLTKIWNRYRMELAIDAELASAKRYGHPCSVLLFDVDHFKSVNDTHGHEIGDQVLAGLAEQVQSKLRSSDYFGRWGGEEFIVLAAHNSLEEALCLAERLRQHIETVTFKKVGKLTVSIGMAQALPEHESRRQLLERADIAMYKAKQSGRNRVEAASAELSAG